MDVKFRKTDPKAITPRYASKGAAGLDLHACLEQNLYVGREPTKISTGIAIEIPPGYFGRVTGRSGNAASGLIVYPGVIDSDYRGELIVLAFTLGWSFTVKHGDRIAQLLLLPVQHVTLHEVEELTPSMRGESGFGSTGVR